MPYKRISKNIPKSSHCSVSQLGQSKTTAVVAQLVERLLPISRDPWFDTSHWKNLGWTFTVNCIEKTKKRPRMGLLKTVCLISSVWRGLKRWRPISAWCLPRMFLKRILNSNSNRRYFIICFYFLEWKKYFSNSAALPLRWKHDERMQNIAEGWKMIWFSR